MELDERYLDLAVGRIVRLMAVMTLAGVILLFFWRDWRWSAGFALGAAASWLNFRWLKKLVDSLGALAAHARPLKNRTAIVLGLRYVLLAAAGYVILRYSEISATAALVGLFVSTAAAIVEILYQLMAYGST